MDHGRLPARALRSGIRREQLAIPIPESREPEYVLVIDDGDSPPVGGDG